MATSREPRPSGRRYGSGLPRTGAWTRASILLVAVAATILVAGDTRMCSHMVTRSGEQLFLDGERFRFTGVNVWNANGRLPNSLYTCGDPVDLDVSAGNFGPGVRVVRVWFFQRLATTPAGHRDWSTFDRTLADARRHGLKVIATLGNQYGDCEGYPSRELGYKDEEWYRSGYRDTLPPGQPSSYRQWVQEVVSRYRNDDQIMLWQMVNEAEARRSIGGPCGAEAATHLSEFVRDMGVVIKSIDPRHLLSIGTMGSGQCGAYGLEYLALHAIPEIDVAEYHDYSPDPMPGDPWNGLAVRLRQAADLGKPLIVGEIGVSRELVGGEPFRAALVRQKLEVQFRAGIAGALLWAWGGERADGMTAGEYDINPGDPVLEELAQMSRQL